MHVIYTCGLLLALLQLGSCLLLGAFNIQTFGKTKASNRDVMDIISIIVHRYDIILIQELIDSDLSVTNVIINYINRAVPGQYNFIVSDPLGPSTYKERYLFLYRTDTVSVVKSFTYPPDDFSRPPFVVMFSSKSNDWNFVLIPQHTSPPKAVQEVNALYDVVTDVSNRWKTQDILLLGDFNAGCSYVRSKDWVKIDLFTDKSFRWLISDDMDTTVRQRKCPYDRIVATANMLSRVVAGSAAVYDYKVDLQLDQETALAVSNHFPVQVRLTLTPTPSG